MQVVAYYFLAELSKPQYKQLRVLNLTQVMHDVGARCRALCWLRTSHPIFQHVFHNVSPFHIANIPVQILVVGKSVSTPNKFLKWRQVLNWRQVIWRFGDLAIWQFGNLVIW